jgi:phosphate/sulfate permease
MEGIALLVALGFEFVNGFHDTANAVATVIYTHTLAARRGGLVGLLELPRRAGLDRRGGVRHHLAAAGRADPAGRQRRRLRHGVRAADRGDHLEPRHLVLGLPASSSHTLIGSIIGVGLANQLMHVDRHGTSGVDWGQASKIGARCSSRRWSASLRGLLLLPCESPRQEQAALRGPEGREAAAVLDPRPADPHLHRRQLRPRLERRSEGHGPDHADPDRHGADGLCAQPRGPDDWDVLKNYRKHIDKSTKFIPGWVKVAVAIALGLGTMIGWKRIVITVGERIGKDHLTYAQGAAAEITAMVTIGAADAFGLPVSTTHVLSSGVAGTMVANHSGLQWATVRNLLMAWVLTLPASILLRARLFWLFSKIG